MHFFSQIVFDLVCGNSGLFHGVTVADGYGVVFFCLAVDGYAEGGACFILSSVAAANGAFFVVEAVKVGF